MTHLSPHQWFRGAPLTAHDTHRPVRRIGELAVLLLVGAALMGAWLAFFWFVPFDFTPRLG